MSYYYIKYTNIETYYTTTEYIPEGYEQAEKILQENNPKELRVLERDGGYRTISTEITANEFIEKQLFNSSFVMILSGIGIAVSIIGTPIVFLE